MATMLTACLLADDVAREQRTGPGPKGGAPPQLASVSVTHSNVEPDLVLAGYLTILARGYLHCEQFMLHMLARFAGGQSMEAAQPLLFRLLDLWLDK